LINHDKTTPPLIGVTTGCSKIRMIGAILAATVTVDAYPGETFPARVSFIWPEVDRPLSVSVDFGP
jgi:hypothetical protein